MLRHSFTSYGRPLLLAGLLLTAGLATHAQVPGTGGTTGGPPSPQATTVPLDGGASLLLASGLAYGLKRLRKRRG